MTQLEIRRALADDATAIAVLHDTSWRETYRSVLPPAALTAVSLAERTVRWEQRLADRTNAARTWVALAGTSLQGFASHGPSEDAATAELLALYVAPAAWGGGTGRGLLSAVLTELAASGNARVVLWVVEENTRARRFYERNGLRPDGARKTKAVAGGALNELRYVRDFRAR